MDTSRISIIDLREVIGNLEYLVEVSTDRFSVMEYTRQLDIFQRGLEAVMVEEPGSQLRVKLGS